MAGKNWISIRPPTSPDPTACPVPEVVLFCLCDVFGHEPVDAIAFFDCFRFWL